MKKLLSVIVVMAAVVLMAGCGSKTDTPSGVAEASIKCIMDKDYKGYVKLMTPANAKEQAEDKDKFKEEQKAMEALLKEKIDKSIEKKGGIKSYEILSEELNEAGDKAKVKVKMIYGDGSEDEQTVKTKKDENGKWLLDIGK